MSGRARFGIWRGRSASSRQRRLTCHACVVPWEPCRHTRHLSGWTRRRLHSWLSSASGSACPMPASSGSRSEGWRSARASRYRRLRRRRRAAARRSKKQARGATNARAQTATTWRSRCPRAFQGRTKRARRRTARRRSSSRGSCAPRRRSGTPPWLRRWPRGRSGRRCGHPSRPSHRSPTTRCATTTTAIR